MTPKQDPFVPALGHDFLTPLYDTLAWLTGEKAFLDRLLQLAALRPGQNVLDLGCGTGTLALLAKERCPEARVVGLDRDPRILAIARRKVARAGLDVELHEGSATAPPFPPGSFDRILSTLVLHHLTLDQKRAALDAARRLLCPAGELHVADWGRPHNWLMRLASFGVRWLDGDETTAPHRRGELPALIAGAGFRNVLAVEDWMTPFGTLGFFRAVAPGGASGR